MSDEVATILVVDDNEMNRDMLSRRLVRQNYQVLMAEDGLKALEMVRTHSCDLVLLDIMMPKMNGYDVLENIKSDETTRHLPVIMISAVDDLDSVVRCIEMGAEDYLFKPFNPVLLKARVTASLDKNRMRKKAQTRLSHVSAISKSLKALSDDQLSEEQREIVAEMQRNLTILEEALEIYALFAIHSGARKRSRASALEYWRYTDPTLIP